jgi:predicted O-methyltransferase YrrM
MNKIIKTIKALGILAKNPWKLNLILNQNEEWEKYVMKKYQQISLPVIPFNSIIHDTITVEPYAFLDGGSLPTDLALLKQLATDINDCKYFEIGTWRGESVSNVAATSAICFTLNLPESELLKHLNDKNFIASQQYFSNNLKNVTHLRGDSRTFDFEGLGIKFDLIFIDGDHHYEAIVSDTQNVLRYLCHENSIIVWHDYTYNPELIRYETMASILDACPEDLHRRIFHVENTNCAVLIKKKIASHTFKKYALPDHYFSVKIKNLSLK